jgi:alpha-methylacyl-CoA racemase
LVENSAEVTNGTMGALSGYTVLDLSFWAPGRGASVVLADLGADVICVEIPRGTRPASFADDDTNVRWLMYQRNKRSITLNLKTDAGQQVLRRLIAKADVIIESFKPGSASRLGADYETARAINPKVVYCSISGFGQTGPYSQLIGHEPNYQGLSGALYENRWDGSPPTVLSILAGDLVGGAGNALVGILAALLHREHSGRGQYLDIAITAGMLPFSGIWTYAKWINDPERVNSSASSGKRPAFRVYPTRDDRWVAISPTEPWHWERFCRAVGREDLIASHGPTSDDAREQLNAELTALFRTRTRDEWTELNLRENLAVTPVIETVEELENDPQMIHRKAIGELEYEPLGTVKQVATQISMSETPLRMEWMSRYGADTDAVLDELGFDAGERASLRADGTCE